MPVGTTSTAAHCAGCACPPRLNTDNANFLQHIVENVDAAFNQVDRNRRRMFAEKPTQLPEVLPGQEARWRQECDHAAVRFCQMHGSVKKHAVQVRMAIQTTAEAPPQERCVLHLPEWRIAHHETPGFARRWKHRERVGHLDDLAETASAGDDVGQQHGLCRQLGKPCREWVKFPAPEPRSNARQQDGRIGTGHRGRRSLRHLHKKSACTTRGVQDPFGRPVVARHFRLAQQAVDQDGRRIKDPIRGPMRAR